MPFEGNGTITGNAINWFAVRMVILGGETYLKTGMLVNSGYTPSRIREFATRHTGKDYRRSRKGLEAAVTDLRTLLANTHPDKMERK